MMLMLSSQRSRESDMDKMREDFEAWHIEQCKADGMDLRDISSELDRNGDACSF